jgi:putative chitinase
MSFDRTVFFNSVRPSLFGGSLSQGQVDGMNFKIDQWRDKMYSRDPRTAAYCLATSYHETGAMMEPVREGFCKSDAEARAYVKKQGYEYAKVDPVTGEVYYGRGDIQTTWPENYKKAGQETGRGDDLYLNPEKMLDAKISADCLFQGMFDGWYRSDSKGKQTLTRYFNDTTDDPYGAREIVNGDKSKVPSWSNGVSIGKLIAGYHQKFLAAIEAAWTEELPPAPAPEAMPVFAVEIFSSTELRITAPTDAEVKVLVNGVEYGRRLRRATDI